MNMWEINAEAVEKVYGGEVNYDEEFYICPECGEPVYSDDWPSSDLDDTICPICGFGKEGELD